MEYCSVYTVTAKPTQQTSQDGLRSWLLSIRASLAGHPVELDTAILSCHVTPLRPQLEIRCLGQSDLYRMVYSVQETEPIHDLLDLPISISVTPLYHPTTTTLYKLGTKLAHLVGRDYLAHPKYALTIVHAYASANNLYHEKSIIFDSTLLQIFGCPQVELRHLWREVCCFIKREEQKPVFLIHQLSDFDKSSSSSSTEVTLDKDFNIYPKDWTFTYKSTSQPIIRTQSRCPKVSKKKSFMRDISVEL
jgi:hypothetical protein